MQLILLVSTKAAIKNQKDVCYVLCGRAEEPREARESGGGAGAPLSGISGISGASWLAASSGLARGFHAVCCLMISPDNCIAFCSSPLALRIHCKVKVCHLCDCARCAYGASPPTGRVFTARYIVIMHMFNNHNSPMRPPVGTRS